MNDVLLVKPEHIQLGKTKYQASRDQNLEKLLNKGGNMSEVFRFNDGRILTVNPVLGSGFLYKNEKVLFDKIIL